MREAGWPTLLFSCVKNCFVKSKNWCLVTLCVLDIVLIKWGKTNTGLLTLYLRLVFAVSAHLVGRDAGGVLLGWHQIALVQMHLAGVCRHSYSWRCGGYSGGCWNPGDFLFSSRVVVQIQLFCVLERVCCVTGFKCRTGEWSWVGGDERRGRRGGRRFSDPFIVGDCLSEAVTKQQLLRFLNCSVIERRN